MALKDIFTMIKADRYTADGKDELNKALEADVKDRTYQVGEISQKTGLQKQGDGSWAPPKNAKGKSDNAALKTFNKMTGSNKSDLDSVKRDYNKALEKNTGKPAGKSVVEARGKEVQSQMKHDELVSRLAEEERIWNKNHPDKAHYNYNEKPAESKPAENKSFKSSDVKKVNSETLKVGDVYAYKGPFGAWDIQNADGKVVMQNLGIAEAKKHMAELANKSGSKPAADSASRVLTGDCKVRVKK